MYINFSLKDQERIVTAENIDKLEQTCGFIYGEIIRLPCHVELVASEMTDASGVKSVYSYTCVIGLNQGAAIL